MQPKNNTLSYFLQLNLATLLISTSGPLGRYIDLPAVLVIVARAALAFLILYVFCRYKNVSFNIAKKDRLPIFLSGVFLGTHWVTYFYSLQLSSVAIGVLSLFTYPIITAFLEPLLLKTKFQKVHLFLGLLVLGGIYFLNPVFDFKSDTTIAVVVGVFSAVLYSLRNIILKTKVSSYNGSSLMCIQLGIVALVLLPFSLTDDLQRLPSQLPWIIALAFVTTAIGHTLFLNCFKHFSITTVSILSCVQPIYGIIIGAIFLKEIPNLSTVIGGTLILSAVAIESLRTRKAKT